MPKRLKRIRIVFLLDVDNTLLDNDKFIADLKQYLKDECGHRRAKEYWTFVEELQEGWDMMIILEHYSGIIMPMRMIHMY